MTQEPDRRETVDLLQDLGLKEYEARSFLALTQMSTATAKEISDHSEVPRTRVYDAVRVLEAEGLVEVQHSSPQEFRAVSVGEAVTTLRRKYEDRLDALESSLHHIELEGGPDQLESMQEVWSLSGHQGIQTRTMDLLMGADSEIMFLVVDESILTEEVFETLRDATDRGVDVTVGTLSASADEAVSAAVPGATVFVTELDWLLSPADDEVAISRILLVDREVVLVSSYYPEERGGEAKERSIVAFGLGNGIVVLIRRLISTGLLEAAADD